MLRAPFYPSRKKISASFQFQTDAYTDHIWRAWYNSSYTITAKPIKMLELHYPMIQFLIKHVMLCYITCYVVLCLCYVIYHVMFMLCYIKCYFMLCYIACYVMLCYITCYGMVYNMSCYVTLYNMLCYVMLCNSPAGPKGAM